MNTKKSHIIVAIDGPSGTGKSTTAKIVAKDLGLTYLDTGAMYRAITFAALEKGIAPENSSGIDQLLRSTRIRFDDQNQIVINGINREKEIRGKQVSEAVSPYSAIPAVRKTLTEWQREIASERSCILDGRDIGTVVFPHADFKFFLVTDLKVRAQRRFLECQEKGIAMTLEEIEKNLAERDRIDSSRATAPLKKADDAFEIDTTQLSIQQQVKIIEDRVGVVA
ncbi:MAG: (d)CMP kinase [Hallerella porci]|uniref:(d)CMP kinase n=1 Tax=Hallerella TaxID=2815788 RepID=UPI000D2A7797|nr:MULTISPECIES: (d)CMP kinase [Hallerella]MCI5601064.1 (d)CMP kinase [Hallerella sp.]MDY3921387.1 (d)CMP kinase [Hallerella porci]